MRSNKVLGLAIMSVALVAATRSPAQPYSNAVISLNPAGYWPLTETVQPPQPMNITAANLGSAGPGANGFYGAWYQPAGPAWYLTNNVLQTPAVTAPFDGSSAMLCQRAPGQYVVVPRNTHGVANPAVTLEPPFTIEAWLQIGTVGNALGTIVSQGGFVNVDTGGPNPSNPFYGGLGTGWAGVTLGQYQDYLFLICQSTNAVGNKNNELDTSGYNQHAGFHVGDWVHVVATFDGTTETIYTNGVFSVSKDVGPNAAGVRYVADPTTPLMIGSGSEVSASYGIAFQGAIHDVAIYSGVLPQTSILTHYETAFGTNATYGSVYTNAVMADAPVLYYRLNDSVTNSSVGYPSNTFPVANNFGTLGASATGVYQPGTTPGLAGPPYQGFGTDSRAVGINGFFGGVDIGNGNLPSGLNPTGNAPLTVVSWFKGAPADAPGRFQEILGHGDSSYRLGLGQNGGDNHFNPGPGPELQFANVSDLVTNGWALNDGQWHMVAGVSDGTNDSLYLDGILVKSGSNPNGINIAGSTNDLILGGDSQYTVPSASAPNTIRYFDGSIAQVAFWTNALSAAQIQQLYGAAAVPPSITQEPESASNNAGSSVTLAVGVRGSVPFSFQWYKNGSPVASATSQSLVLNPVGLTDAGNYFVTIGNSSGSVTSTVAQVTVNGAPVIEGQSATALQVFRGANPTLRVSATGPSLSYQWSLNGTAMVGATATAFTATNIQASGSYTCVVSNNFGSQGISPISITVLPTPAANYPARVIKDNPLSYFRLDETSGTIAYDYAGGLNGIYTNVILGQPGYSTNEPAEMSTEFGNPPVDSYVGWVPGYLNFETPAGGSAAFSIEAWVNSGFVQNTDAGIVALGYGNGGEQFNLDCGGHDPAHDFRFFVRDASGAVHAVTAGISPSDNNWHHVVAVCDEPNGTVSLYVDGALQGTGSIPVNAGILSSSTPLSIGSRQSGLGTEYDNQFRGNIDDVSIYAYALTEGQVQAHYYASGIAPVFAAQPTNTTFNLGATAYFYATVSGTPPLAYQWFDVTTGTAVALAGQTNTTLALSNVTQADDGHSYDLMVSNAYGQATSMPAVLTVLVGPPVLVSDIQPLLAMSYAGTPFTYSVQVSGSAPFTYTWTRNGSPIAGATTSSYSFNSTVGTNLYAVMISNSAGSTSSSTATNIGFAVPTLSPGDYTYKMKITFAGYNKAETLSGFPALVRIGTNLAGFAYSQLAGDGGDLRFTDASGTREIPHEIDEWDPSGVSSVWVQVPTLSTNTDYIWAYWGNPAAATPENWSTNGEVWVPRFGLSPGYLAVYHLKEGALPFADGTTAHDATNGVAPVQTPGVVGTAGLFDGSSWLDVGTNDVGGAFTLSSWVNINPTPAQIETVWANQHGGFGAPGFALFVNTYNAANQILDFASGDGGTGGNETQTGAGAVSYSQWHLLEAAIDLNAGTTSFYLDGADILDGNGVVKDLTTLGDLNLGRFIDGNFGMHGAMDEARVRLATSDAAWVWADYMTVAQNSTFENYSAIMSSAVTVSATRSGNTLILSWPQGTLQSASQLGGSFSDVTNATSPYSVPLSGAQQYFRVRVR